MEQLDAAEWEALCDGCGRCCLLKLEDEADGAIAVTSIACQLLNCTTCRCTDYANRHKQVPDCRRLTPETVRSLRWLPQSCAYRLVAEGKPLPAWHHLVCGERERVHREGYSVRGWAVSERTVEAEMLEDHITDWLLPDPK